MQNRNRLTWNLEYVVYLCVLIFCIAGLYWRFWYRPHVDPVVMLDPSCLTNKGQAIPRALLDPDFSWNLIRTLPTSSMAVFMNDRNGMTVTLEIGEEIDGWKIKKIEKTMVILVNKDQEERALFYSAKRMEN
ncbi:MAG TPA: hypothetical protein VHR47_03200 [Bacillota bacterium]|nr:hypothetical protein [Bacillota bacterium]